MEELLHIRLADLVCRKLMRGLTAREIADWCELSMEQLYYLVSVKTSLSPNNVMCALSSRDRGCTNEEIAVWVGVELSSLEEFLPKRHDIVKPSGASRSPSCIYSYSMYNSNFCRLSLTSMKLTQFPFGDTFFKDGSALTVVPNGVIWVTLGDFASQNHSIDTLREFSRIVQPKMYGQRKRHAAVYYSGHLYVIGGIAHSSLNTCERYSFNEGTWTTVSSLRLEVHSASAVACEATDCLYALGGHLQAMNRETNIIQRYYVSLDKWDFMELMLPSVALNLPCFAFDGKLYVYINWQHMVHNESGSLYKLDLTNEAITKVKNLNMRITSPLDYTVYLDGTLYTSNDRGTPNKCYIGPIEV
mmetsp:Transcript_25759/g.45343  ORF Transcript_25759/g.45343 Transcript_25759/m.45343 type:complete len:359 (-) Transcript_25759:71-1147(-)